MEQIRSEPAGTLPSDLLRRLFLRPHEGPRAYQGTSLMTRYPDCLKERHDFRDSGVGSRVAEAAVELVPVVPDPWARDDHGERTIRAERIADWVPFGDLRKPTVDVDDTAIQLRELPPRETVL